MTRFKRTWKWTKNIVVVVDDDDDVSVIVVFIVSRHRFGQTLECVRDMWN